MRSYVMLFHTYSTVKPAAQQQAVCHVICMVQGNVPKCGHPLQHSNKHHALLSALGQRQWPCEQGWASPAGTFLDLAPREAPWQGEGRRHTHQERLDRLGTQPLREARWGSGGSGSTPASKSQGSFCMRCCQLGGSQEHGTQKGSLSCYSHAAPTSKSAGWPTKPAPLLQA